MTDEQQAPDWFTIAQAAVQVARDIASENVGNRVELVQLRSLNEGKDKQLSFFESSFNRQAEDTRRFRNLMKPVLDQIEWFQNRIEGLESDDLDHLSVLIGTNLINAMNQIDVDELRKECGCGEADPG